MCEYMWAWCVLGDEGKGIHKSIIQYKPVIESFAIMKPKQQKSFDKNYEYEFIVEFMWHKEEFKAMKTQWSSLKDTYTHTFVCECVSLHHPTYS